MVIVSIKEISPTWPSQQTIETTAIENKVNGRLENLLGTEIDGE